MARWPQGSIPACARPGTGPVNDIKIGCHHTRGECDEQPLCSYLAGLTTVWRLIALRLPHGVEFGKHQRNEPGEDEHAQNCCIRVAVDTPEHGDLHLLSFCPHRGRIHI